MPTMTDFLFSNPSFFSGAASVLDLFGIYDEYNVSRTGSEADQKAIYNDWKSIGQDLKTACDVLVNDQNAEE